MLLEDLPFIQHKKNSFVKEKVRQFFADVKMEKIKSRWQLRRQLPTADVN